MGPDSGQGICIFSGSFFGTPFAPKTLLFARKNQHYEVYFGQGAGFFKIFGGCQDGPRQAQDSGNLGHLGAILGHPGVILSRLGAILGSLGPSWGHLEAVLGVPEAILGSLGAVLGHLGSVLALSWAIPERPRASQSVPRVVVSAGYQGRPLRPVIKAGYYGRLIRPLIKAGY